MQPQNATDVRRWEFAGPVARAFELSRAPVAAIEGPTGGGKSTASSRRCLRVATWQHPSPISGVRKARVVCVCPTYRRAWDQVIPSFGKVFPLNARTFKGSRGDPAEFTYDKELVLNGTLSRIHLEVLFRAVNDMDIEEFFRGFEFTALWLPEADTNGDLPTILSLGANRVGRYPDPEDRPEVADPAYVGIWCDANAPIIGSPYHDRFHLKRLPDKTPAPATDRLYRQPSGFSPQAENMKSLRKIRADFYEYQASQLNQYDVRRMLMNLPGYSRHGQPVHANFDPAKHVAPGPLEVDRHSVIYISIDAGSNTLHPAAVFWQRGYGGQWRAMAEIHVAMGQLNNAAFCGEITATLARRFPNMARDAGALICVDPAANAPNAHSEHSTAMEIQALTNIEVLPAPTNMPADRRGALDKLFLADVAPGSPKIIVDPQCEGLIGGLSGGFHYQARGGKVGLFPVKNVYSHVCEAAEYGPLTIDGVGPREDRFIRPGGEGSYAAPVGIYAD